MTLRRHLLFALLAASATPAFAQDQQPLPSPEEINAGNSLTVAAGGGIIPDYEGSDDYKFIPAAAIRGKVGTITFSTRGLYFYVDVVNGSGKVDFDVGPIAGVRFNRTGKIKDVLVNLLPDRKTAIEVGGFAGVSFKGLTNPYDSLGVRVDVVHDIANAHKSTVFSPNIEFSTPLSRSVYVVATASADFVSNRFADYYFSVSPTEATLSGLPAFNASGGMKSWKLGLLANYSLSGDLRHGVSLFGLGNYSRLVGDFKRTPIVSQRGSASQWLGAIGLAYTW
ncbi:MipA/OmpV family protein [Sphingomonas sp.]|uniref:MipA/OmpV family protein n=1 Tax=Sphingomonas sp. TaxID=28214 RepID=UPI002869F548|nr:MipA/OmpV family protein [Sphingomonas sp.]